MPVVVDRPAPAKDQSVDADLALALRLADAADAVTLPRFGAANLRVDSKPDLTPVTDADLATEQALRKILATERPDDTVLGEEFGLSSAATSGRRWVIDPIDGTKNFVRGVPVWGTLIGLLEDDDTAPGGTAFRVGVVSAPALARRWWAAAGGGAWTRFAGPGADPAPRRCRVSAVGTTSDASLSFSEPTEWTAAGRRVAFDALADSCWRVRGYGDFYSYLLVAEGAVDIAAEPELNLWDIAALVAIVAEAGGTVTDLAGHPTGPESTSLVATNGLLHPGVIAALNG